MSITNTNKLIAEFMGYEIEESIKNELVYAIERFNPDTNSSQVDFYSPEELKYHTSWDWLMPVLTKLESAGFYISTFGTEGEYCVTIDRVDDKMRMITEHGSDKLRTTYNAVVAFIKLHR